MDVVSIRQVLQSITGDRGFTIAGHSGVVVARLPTAREGPGLNRAADKNLCFHDNHCESAIRSFGHRLHTDCSA